MTGQPSPLTQWVVAFTACLIFGAILGFAFGFGLGWVQVNAL